jgi:hypothetical protein
MLLGPYSKAHYLGCEGCENYLPKKFLCSQKKDRCARILEEIAQWPKSKPLPDKF